MNDETKLLILLELEGLLDSCSVSKLSNQLVEQSRYEVLTCYKYVLPIKLTKQT